MQEMQEMGVQSLGQEDPLEKEMATDSSVLPCKILWMEEPGRLQSMGCKESDTTEHTHMHSLQTFLCFWHMFLPILFAGLTKTPSESNLEWSLSLHCFQSLMNQPWWSDDHIWYKMAIIWAQCGLNSMNIWSIWKNYNISFTPLTYIAWRAARQCEMDMEGTMARSS